MGTREGELRPAPAVGQMTTSELQQRRRELEQALRDKNVGSAPIAADLKNDLKTIQDEQDNRARAEVESRAQERARRVQREALLRIGQGG
jgi:hypothetical protein